MTKWQKIHKYLQSEEGRIRLVDQGSETNKLLVTRKNHCYLEPRSKTGVLFYSMSVQQ